MNDDKEANNKYRNSFYTSYTMHQSWIVFAPNFLRIPSIFHAIKIGLNQKKAHTNPERWYYFYLLWLRDH